MNEQVSVITKRGMSTSMMVKIGVLAMLSYVLMQFELAIPIFPSFLKMDASDLPALIGALSMGPLAGVFIELVKNMLHGVIQSSTGGVGEVANFAVGAALILPLGFIYPRMKNAKGYIVGGVCGVALMAVLACALNYYVLIPLFAALFAGGSVDTFVNIAQSVNSRVVDFPSLIVFAIAPFNVLKGVIVICLGYFLHKALAPVLY